ncbi:Ral GTPase-activating protein subunit alpha/beta N-terminal domain-containing protein [Entamoeba marina]
MFSPTLGELNLIQIELNTDIVRMFKVEIQRIIVQSVTLEMVTNPEDFQSKLCTHDHCKWAMEVIGCGFTLPVDDHKTIAHCITIYENWIVKKLHTPAPICDNQDHYDKIVMTQLTNLLYQRSGSVEGLNGYADLCLRAIAILRSIGQRYPAGSDMARQLICCLLGCMQDVCGKTHCNTQSVIIPYIVEKLIHALHEAWLNYGEADDEIWNVLKTSHKVWAKTKEVALAWVDITLRIQKALLESIESKQENVELAIDTELIKVRRSFTLKYFLKTWMRYVHLCGSPSQYQNAAVVLVITEGIFILVKNLIETYKDGNYPTAPDGNAIVNIFGEPLAQVILTLDHIRYDPAVSVAVTTIGTVFGVTMARTTFKPQHLAILYRSMAEAILSPNGKITLHAIKILDKLLLLAFPGQEILYPSILRAAGRIANLVDPASKETRTCCIKLLSNIHLSFSSQRNGIIFNEIATTTPFEFSSFSKVFFTTCLTFLQTESSPTNLNSLFILLARFFADIVPREGPALVVQCLTVLEKNIHKWVSSLIEKSLHTSFTEMLRILKTALLDIDSTKPMLDILLILHNFIEMYYKTCPVIDDFLQIYVLYFASTYRLLSHDFLFKIIGLSGQICAWYSDPAKRATLQNYTFSSSFASAIEIDVVQHFEELNEVILMNALNDNNILNFDEYLKIFVYKDQAVLTVSELPWDPASCLVIFRSIYGKTARKVALTQITEHLPQTNDHVPINDKKIDWLEEFSTVSINDLVNSESQCLCKPTPIQHTQYLPASTLHNQTLVCKSVTSKSLLGSFSDELITSLLELDVLPTRNLIGMTILYGPDATAPSPIFNAVIRGLGHVVDPQTHHGFSGLYAGTDQKFIYYSDEESEIVFHINTLGGLNEEDAVDADNIVVFWNSSPYDTEIDTIEGKFTIIILPTQSDCLRVITNSPCGILLKEQLVSPSALPHVLRQAALSYSRPLYLSQSSNPITKRGEYIQSLGLFIDSQNPRAEVHAMLSADTLLNANSSNLSFVVDKQKKESREPRGEFLKRKQTIRPTKELPVNIDLKKKSKTFKGFGLFSSKKGKHDKPDDK